MFLTDKYKKFYHDNSSDCDISFFTNLPFVDDLVMKTIDWEKTVHNHFYYASDDIKHELKSKIINYLIPNVSSNNLAITCGAQEGILLVLNNIFSKFSAKTIMLEKYNYIGLENLLNHLKINTCVIPNLQDIDISVLEQLLKRFKPSAFYIQADNANPTGYTLSLFQREKLINLSKKHHFTIIEDSTYRWLTFGKMLPTLSYLNNSVITVGSLSKMFFPSLRIGFVVASTQTISSIEKTRKHTDLFLSDILLSAATKLIENRSKLYAKTILVYKENINLACQMLDPYSEVLKYQKPAGGYFLWVKHHDATQLINKLLKRGVLVAPGRLFDMEKEITGEQFFRLSLSQVKPEQIKEGLRRMIDCLKR